MSRSTELGNPFREPAVAITDDRAFIEEFLGTEAAENFAALGNARTVQTEKMLITTGDLSLTDQERRDIQYELPLGYWKQVQKLAILWDETVDSGIELDRLLNPHAPQNKELWNALRLNPYQLQELCRQFLIYRDVIDTFKHPGHLFSALLAKSIEALPEDEQQSIHLCLGDTEQADHLGWMWSAGTLVLTEPAGSYLGINMGGGRIIAPRAKNRVGQSMRGGVIELSQAGNNLGIMMRGGRIIVDEARDWLGAQMSDGEIHARIAGYAVGNEMTGGKIIIGEAGRQLGYYMEGGSIVVEHAGAEVGDEMTPECTGEIRVTGSAQSYSRAENAGGIIYRPDGSTVEPWETQ